MRRKYGVAWLAVIGSLLLLAGCATQPPIPVQIVETPEPIFVSEDEALAAVVEHYREYLAVVDEVYSQGGTEPERIEPYVTAERYLEEIQSVNDFRVTGHYLVGTTKTSNPLLQRVSYSDEVAHVAFYICIDVSEVGLMNNEGQRLPDIEQSIPFVIHYEVKQISSETVYTLAGDEIWQNHYECH